MFSEIQTSDIKNKQEVMGRTKSLHFYYNMDHSKNNKSKNTSTAACAIIAAATFLSSHCLAMTGGYTYSHTDCWEGFMKYAVEMGSGAMIYIPSLIKTGSGIQKLMGEGGIHRQHGDCMSLTFAFSQQGNQTVITV
jgi:hypothetical protein